MIVDYSTFRPTIGMLKQAGVTAVGRYIGWDSVPGYQQIGKNITATEADSLIAAGISIFLSFEYAADAALLGAAQGDKDGRLAGEQLTALGAPEGMAVYFAVDFDVADYAPTSTDPKAKLGPVADYFEAINALTLGYQVGVYGGFYAVSRAMSAGLAAKGWQTIAWSGGQWYEPAVLRQLGTQIWGNNADVDLLVAQAADYGQWPRPTTAEEYRANGTTSLQNVAHQQGMTISEILWLTAQHKPDGYGSLEMPYIDDGNWNADMPAGMLFWA
jgi:hypothetical protein